MAPNHYWINVTANWLKNFLCLDSWRKYFGGSWRRRSRRSGGHRVSSQTTNRYRDLRNTTSFKKDIGYENVQTLDALPSAQICSQLTNRLERQQAAHKEELDSLKVRTALFLWYSTLILSSFISPFTAVLLWVVGNQMFIVIMRVMSVDLNSWMSKFGQKTLSSSNILPTTLIVHLCRVQWGFALTVDSP